MKYVYSLFVKPRQTRKYMSYKLAIKIENIFNIIFIKSYPKKH